MPRPASRAATASWQREALGPALVLLATLAVALVSEFVGRIPNPPAILLLFVVFGAFHGGVRAGLVSAVIACAYFAVAFSRPGHLWSYAPDDFRRVVVWTVAVPIMALMVGTLKARALAAERAAAHAAEERFVKAFHASPVAVILTRSSDDTMIDVNDAALSLSGYGRAEMIGTSATVLGLYRDPSQRAEWMARLLVEGRLSNIDIEVQTKSAGTASVLASIELVRVDSEDCLLAFLVDITARQRAEESLRGREAALRKTQNLEALGRLAGGVAHDFNNLLTVIGGNAGLLAELSTDPEAKGLADDIVMATTRAATLTRQLLEFGRPQPQTGSTVHLSDTVAKLEPMLARTLGESIRLVVELDPQLGAVPMSAGQLDRVIMNLVLNARAAMPRGGTLTLTTDARMLEAGTAHLAREGTRGPLAVLTVRDTGEGMDTATQERIFEPFFTTKALGGGSGLGLSTVHANVAAAGGFITVESAAGQGAAFAVHLPMVEGGPIDDAVVERVRGQGELVLVVEDDDAVRALTARLVTDLGYGVLVADGGAQALELIDRESRVLSAIITDVIMPGMTGPQLVTQLRRRLPAVKVIFVSGYSNDDGVQGLLSPDEIVFLPKPFGRDALAQTLSDLLSPPHR